MTYLKETIPTDEVVKDNNVEVFIDPKAIMYLLGYTLSLIDMTLTSPNCPEAQSIPNNVRKAVERLGHYDEVVVRIVWDPSWDKSKMSEVAKLALNS